MSREWECRDVSAESAREEGQSAACRQVPLEECPYTRDDSDFDLIFNPRCARAWRTGWREITRRKLAAMPGPLP